MPVTDILDYPVQQALLKNVRGVVRVELLPDSLHVTVAFDNTRDGILETTIPLTPIKPKGTKHATRT